MVIRFLKSLVEEAAYVRLAKKLMIDSGEESQICGCYYCKKLFFKEDIEEWVRRSDKYGKDAICPYCGVDAVIFHSEKARLTKSSLDALHNYMFGMLHEVNMGDSQRTPE